MRSYIVRISILLIAFVANRKVTAQPVRNTYRFYNTLSTTEPDCAADIVPSKGLNRLCQSSTATTAGQFILDTLAPSNITRIVYHNNLNWGLKYLNTDGVIANSYTVQIYLRITNFNEFYTRLIDFSDGEEDNGIYFTNFNTPSPSDKRCFNFYPTGNFGICPFFNNSTYYLITITRNDLTRKVDIYVNDQLFTSYNDAADFYVSTPGKPIYIFRDDPVGFACEDGEANFAYVSFANYYSDQAGISLVYHNLNSVVNTADFSVSSSSICKGSEITINYTGNIPANANQYIFNWDWDGGNVSSGFGRGPYNLDWSSAGTKNVTLNITGGGCASALTNIKQILVKSESHLEIDTSICAGASFEGYSIPGIYVDTFSINSECGNIRTIKLSNIVLQTPDLGGVKNLCRGDSVVLFPGKYESYLWQDGSTQKTYFAKKAGIYSVTVANKCTSAIAEVEINETNCYLYFPNSFSPNKDGRNEYFKILSTNVFSEYSLMVYDRYGEKIFESNNPVIGWDGKFKGKDVEEGAYVWYCSLKKTNTPSRQFLQGTVILLR